METWVQMIEVALFSGCAGIILYRFFQSYKEKTRPLYGKRILIFCEKVNENLCGLNLLSNLLEAEGAYVSLSSGPRDNPKVQSRSDINIMIVVDAEGVKISKVEMFNDWKCAIEFDEDSFQLQYTSVLDKIMKEVLEMAA